MYDRYRVTVVGSVFKKMQIGKFEKIKKFKIAFYFRGEIGKTKLHKMPRKKFAEDGRLRTFGSGGRK